MLISLLKVIFGKVIGIDRIPEKKREEFWSKLSEYSIKLAGEMSEGATRGAVNNRG